MKDINPVLLQAKHSERLLLEANAQYPCIGVTHLEELMGSKKLKYLFMHLRRNAGISTVPEIIRYLQTEN